MERKIESFRKAFGETLVELGEKNEDIFVLDADVAGSTKTVLFAKKFPRRFLNVGISEQDMVGTSAGLAADGRIPIVATFSIFLFRAWEQIRNTIARDNLNVKLVATHAGLSNCSDGSSHQCLEDIAITRVIPNMCVVVPADAISTRELLFQACEMKGPVYMRIGRDFAPRVYENIKIKLGKAKLVKDGKDVTIISSGIMVSVAIEAAMKLKRIDIDARVLDFHTIKPLDKKAIIKAAKETGRIVTIEEHSIIGGLGGAVAEVLAEKIHVPMRRIGVSDSFGTSSLDYQDLLKKFGLSSENVIKNVKVLIDGNS